MSERTSDILVVDLVKALYADAEAEIDPIEAARKMNDAEIFRGVWERSKYALAPTRSQMTAAVGNASLNIADTLQAVVAGQKRVEAKVGEMHLHVQHNDTLVSEFIATFRTEQQALHAEREGLGRQVKKLEAELVDRVNELDQRHGAQWQEVVERLDNKRKRFEVDEERITRIEALLEARPAQRAEEHQQLVDAAVAAVLERLSEHGDGR